MSDAPAFCSACGARLAPNAAACSRCGAAMVLVRPPVHYYAAAPAARAARSRHGRGGTNHDQSDHYRASLRTHPAPAPARPALDRPQFRGSGRGVGDPGPDRGQL